MQYFNNSKTLVSPATIVHLQPSATISQSNAYGMLQCIIKQLYLAFTSFY